ncbi:MAG: hypothetical protein V1862_09495 [Methanobacteriota archaeon]
MGESIEIPAPLMQKLERLKTGPDEAPIDVITRLIDYFDEDDDYINYETEEVIRQGLEKYKAGKSISHKELGEELRFI